jgi:alpha-glucosidase
VLGVERFAGDVFRVCVTGPRWPRSSSQVQLDWPVRDDAGQSALGLGRRGELLLSSSGGAGQLRSVPGEGFGVCGSTWLFHFALPDAAELYGMGEKCIGFERSGVTTRFWNMDVWADFPMSQVEHGEPDPLYASVPWVIVKQGNAYVGLLLNGTGSAFLRASPRPAVGGVASRRLWLGAEDGAPELIVIVGPSLRELTEKLQRLLGVTPRPPLWALGHHQSRWGYESQAQLDALADDFARHRVPNDGLWLDIGYMRGYRVFSVDSKHWPLLESALSRLRARGQRVVPILDPGVKLEQGYDVYDQGRRRRAFCLTPEGQPFVGYVWPGKTVFPDFSLATVRDFWAERVAQLASRGFAGFWLDMNDPSTGASDPGAMLFDRGRQSHASYHNQYASGMARASREGLLRAAPDERPFLLTRSACAISWRSSEILRPPMRTMP